jgi:hypothetical protein
MPITSVQEEMPLPRIWSQGSINNESVLEEMTLYPEYGDREA